MQRYLPFILGGLLFASAVAAQESTISVQGNVNKPGVYPVDAKGMTISDALKRAGGLIAGAGAKAVIYRSDEHGVPHEIPIALRPILDHKAVDVALKTGDVLYVPGPGARAPSEPVIYDPVLNFRRK